MRITQIIQKDTYKAKFIVSFCNDIYNIDNLQILPVGKKVWNTIELTGIKFVPMQNRAAYTVEIYLKYLTIKDIENAYLELWQKMKPLITIVQ